MRQFTGIILTTWCVMAVMGAAVSLAEVHLSLEPANVTVSPGGVVQLQLWARADSAESFDGVEVLLQWDVGLLALQGNSDDGGLYDWWVSGFPNLSPFNDVWSDGDALYQALSAFSGTLPETDLLVTTFQFNASQDTGMTEVTFSADENTEVASGGESVLGTVAGATITVASDEDASGSNGSGDDGGTGEEPADEDDGGGGTENEDGGASTGDTDVQDPAGENSDDTSTGNNDADDDTVIAPPPADDEDSDTSTTPVSLGLCGAGVVETLTICVSGFFLFAGSRRWSRYGA